jgi:hypothetical protein
VQANRKDRSIRNLGDSSVQADLDYEQISPTYALPNIPYCGGPEGDLDVLPAERHCHAPLATCSKVWAIWSPDDGGNFGQGPFELLGEES